MGIGLLPPDARAHGRGARRVRRGHRTQRERRASTSSTRSRWRSRGCCSSRPGELDGRHGAGRAGATHPGAPRATTRDGGVALSFLAQMTFAKGDHARALTLYRRSARVARGGRRPPRDRARALRDGLDRARRRGRARGADARSCVAVHDLRGGRQPARDRARAAGPRGGRGGRGPAGARRGDRGGGARVVGARRRRDRAPDGSRASPSRIEALKASIPQGTLDGLVANASTLSPAAVLAMVAE